MQMPHTSCLESKSYISLILSGRRDSNPRPEPWQGPTLPAELLLQINSLQRVVLIYKLCIPFSTGLNSCFLSPRQ